MSQINVSAPGSIMLMGEHAVLFEQPALVMAVDKYIHLSLTTRDDNQIEIDSALANYQSDLTELKEDNRLSFVIAAIRQFQALLPSGFNLKIESEFSHTVGLGSSAAVTAAVVTALSALCGQSLEKQTLFQQALSVVHQVQGGRGSGSDLVASIYGGISSYRMTEREITPLLSDTGELPVVGLYYSGYKTPTPEVLACVEAWSADSPEIYQQLYKLMGQVSEQAERAVQQKQWSQLGRLMNNYHGLMDALGVSDVVLSELVYRLRQSEKVLGAKISGSGLGDCVVSLGDDASLQIPYQHFSVEISKRGVVVDVN